MTNCCRLFISIFLFLGCNLNAYSAGINITDDATETGLNIAVTMDDMDSGFENYAVDMEMVLRNKNGKENRRLLKTTVLEQNSDGDWSRLLFINPRDIKGTSLLTYNHAHKNNDQWLYLPALKRVKRISSGNTSGAFVGSEFAYEDITAQMIEKYNYRYIRKENLNGIDCYVVERYPVNKKSGYSKQVVWIDEKKMVQIKVDYYDRKGSHLKTLTTNGLRQYLNKHWRAESVMMINHKTGNSTELIWSNYEFKTSVKKRDFSVNSLKKNS